MFLEPMPLKKLAGLALMHCINSPTVLLIVIVLPLHLFVFAVFQIRVCERYRVGRVGRGGGDLVKCAKRVVMAEICGPPVFCQRGQG